MLRIFTFVKIQRLLLLLLLSPLLLLISFCLSFLSKVPLNTTISFAVEQDTGLLCTRMSVCSVADTGLRYSFLFVINDLIHCCVSLELDLGVKSLKQSGNHTCVLLPSTHRNCEFYPHSVFMCFMQFSQLIAIISLNQIN
jgi:hypothetical protein